MTDVPFKAWVLTKTVVLPTKLHFPGMGAGIGAGKHGERYDEPGFIRPVSKIQVGSVDACFGENGGAFDSNHPVRLHASFTLESLP